MILFLIFSPKGVAYPLPETDLDAIGHILLPISLSLGNFPMRSVHIRCRRKKQLIGLILLFHKHILHLQSSASSQFDKPLHRCEMSLMPNNPERHHKPQ